MRGTGSIVGALILTCALLAAVTAAGTARAAEGGWTLETVLKQLDRTGKGLETVVAEVKVSSVGEETTEESGKMHLDHKKGAVRFDLPEAADRMVLCDGKTLSVHKPDQQVVEVYQLAKSPGMLPQYAFLGFGTRSKDLQMDFLVTFIDEVELEGQKTLLLELTPKSEGVRGAVSKIQIWIDQASWIPAQQKMFHGGADSSLTVRYLNASRNVPVDKALFNPKWPKGTKKVKK